jgi:hypothetical protein
MEKVATIILNRNLPEVTDALVAKFEEQNCGENDVYVIESGSEREKLSRHTSWWANWPEAMQEGLRYPRGFNYGLSQLWKEGAFENYQYFFLVCNDVAFSDDLVPVLLTEMERHPRVGILSPCCADWAERAWIGEDSTKYVCHGLPLAWFCRREMIESVMDRVQPDHLHFLFDGSNFRGDGTERELIAKGYINEWATAITTKALITEQTNILRTGFDRIRTDRVETNDRMLIAEGNAWMKRKYGFTNRLHMIMYVKMFYDRFFALYPNLAPWRL